MSQSVLLPRCTALFSHSSRTNRSSSPAILGLLTGLFILITGFAQEAQAGFQQTTLTQTARGRVVDVDAQVPLIGVNVVVVGSRPLLGASSDENGRFEISGVPVGRVTLQFSYIGYEPLVISDVLVTAGKELVLEIELQESVVESEEIVVVADEFEGVAVNDMAAVSARSFSVEQTQRYAASISDPARMAQTFAGVSGGGDDLLNEIVIRGNAPKGILWRLEGIEIPNPNHFGEEGASGGGVSMLSAGTMSRSDFFTGAFPAEYGNAVSGVFDLFLRNGNLARREHAFQFGALGLEASSEGPFSSGYNGSYLVNYRYSTLGILNNFGVLPDESIQYQDLSFKFTLPTRNAGHFTLFGLAGDARDVYSRAVRDSSMWRGFGDALDGQFSPKMGVVGASHLLLLGPNTYLKTVAAAMGEKRIDEELFLIPEQGYQGLPIFQQNTRNWAYRALVTLNHKFDARHTLHIGAGANRLGFDLFYRERNDIDSPWATFLDRRGNTSSFTGHIQLKYRPAATLTITPGIHYTHFALNESHVLEPRLGASWQVASGQTLSLGLGLHSRPEPTGLYLIERDGILPHKDLDLMKAWHYVIGYDRYFTDKFRLKLEAYYQYLFDVPVSADAGNPIFSTLNISSVWPVVFDDDTLVNGGSGRNYGVELTLEKYLSDGYYALFTGSLYDARYTPLDGNDYHTRYAGNYVANAVAGKEFNINKNSLLGFNARFVLAGGIRYVPLDAERTRAEQRIFFDLDNVYTQRIDDYYRLDVGVSYTINRTSLTHAIRFDIQNVTGRENVQGFNYNRNLEPVPFFHAGLIPILSYRVTF